MRCILARWKYQTYLKENGITQKNYYNQIANFTYLDTQVNKDISDDAPNEYFSKAFTAVENGDAAYGNIKTPDDLRQNLEQNCIPATINEMTFADYDTFLKLRREMMAKKIQNYYNSL